MNPKLETTTLVRFSARGASSSYFLYLKRGHSLETGRLLRTGCLFVHLKKKKLSRLENGHFVSESSLARPTSQAIASNFKTRSFV